MSGPSSPGDEAAEFAHAVAALRTVPLRPEVRLSEMPAPRRIAPYAVALSASVVPAGGTDELATGRFIVLHDPSCPPEWQGRWRVVTFARAELEEEVATDPSIGEVGWAWLVEALAQRGVEYLAEAGTVTRVFSQSFGGLADRHWQAEVEIRASWTPLDADLGEHLVAWSCLLATLAGLPPLPEGVVPLPDQRP